jgi:threonine synthase
VYRCTMVTLRADAQSGSKGGLREGEIVVCTLTGHGLKDADTAISVSAQPKTVRATREDVARLLRV